MPIVAMPNGDRVEFPDDMPKEQIKGMIAKKFPEAASSGWNLAKEEGLGALKGFAKGVGGLALEVPGLGTPSVGELDPGLKKMVDAPSSTVGESVGRFAGETLPFAIAGPEGLVGRTLVGGLAGAAQPTEGGWRARAINAATGAGGAALFSPPVLGRIAGSGAGVAAGLTLEELARRYGYLPVLGALGGLGGLGSLYGHYGLGGLAHRVFGPANTAGRWIGAHIPAGVAGAAGGKTAEGIQENAQQQ